MVGKSSHPDAWMSSNKHKTQFATSSHFILRLSVKSHYLKLLKGICSTIESLFDLIPVSVSCRSQMNSWMFWSREYRKLFACGFLWGFLTHQRRAQHSFALCLELVRMTSNMQAIRWVLTVCSLCSVLPTTD